MKVKAEVPEDGRVLEVRRFMKPTSDRLETWLIRKSSKSPQQPGQRLDYTTPQTRSDATSSRTSCWYQLARDSEKVVVVQIQMCGAKNSNLSPCAYWTDIMISES